MCCRTDICGCFSQDIPPHLPLPTTWMQVIALPSNKSFSVEPNAICDIWDSELLEIRGLKPTYELLSIFISNPGNPPDTWIGPVLHRLLSLRPLQPNVSPTRASVIEEVCRLGTLLSLAPRWRSFGTHPIRTVTIRRKLFAILNTYVQDWGNLRILLLWSLAHATREAEEDVERRNFAVRLAW
jgi:hypothetical protein